MYFVSAQKMISFSSDMMVLRDEQMYKTPYSRDFMTRDRSYVSSTTLVPRGS